MMNWNNSFYNLIVHTRPGERIPDNRILEGTPQEILGIFVRNGAVDYDAVASLPTVLVQEFWEDDDSTFACVGYLDRYSTAPSIAKAIVNVSARDLLDAGVVKNQDTHRTYWAVLQGDLFKMIAGRTLSVPDAPVTPVDRNLIAVMMPFDDNHDVSLVYGAIQDGAAAAGYTCMRVDEDKRPGNIVSKIKETIEKSRAVVVDISGFNPNVMYEFGYAQKCGKPTIVLCEAGFDRLPFDVCQEKVISYRKQSRSELKALTDELIETLKTLQA